MSRVRPWAYTSHPISTSASTWMPRRHTWLTHGSTWHATWQPDPLLTRSLTGGQPPLTGGQLPLTGGPAVVNSGVPPLTVVDRRRWPPLTGGGSGNGDGTVIVPCGTTQVMTRGYLMIEIQVWRWQLRGCRLSGGSVLGTRFRWQGGSEIIG
ncbi:hypothetical protein Tco_0046304 [Tanacetum coccineum]